MMFQKETCFGLGALSGAILGLVVFIVLDTSGTIYRQGYTHGQVDCLTGKVVVELQEKPDGTRKWATTQPIERRNKDQYDE